MRNHLALVRYQPPGQRYVIDPLTGDRRPPPWNMISNKPAALSIDQQARLVHTIRTDSDFRRELRSALGIDA